MIVGNLKDPQSVLFLGNDAANSASWMRRIITLGENENNSFRGVNNDARFSLSKDDIQTFIYATEND